jgi:hypothetical protein
MMTVLPTDELPRPGAAIDEWLFAAWSADAGVGFLSGHRVLGAFAWYWSALVEAGHPVLHLAEWAVRVRADPFIVKAPEMWAEHHCVAPLEQWSIGNEAHFSALDDPDEMLGRQYGTPTPMASDLEWYAADEPVPIPAGYRQAGVVHGEIELLGRSNVVLVEMPAMRWRRSTDDDRLGPVEVEPIVAHTGLRAAFEFPDGSVADWVLSPLGWRSRRPVVATHSLLR